MQILPRLLCNQVSRIAIALSLGLAISAVAGDVHLDVLKTRTDSFEDVTVTGSNKTDIFVIHSGGMANVKINELDAQTLYALGMGPKPPEPEPVLGTATTETVVAADAEESPAMAAALEAMMKEDFEGAFPGGMPSGAALPADLQAQLPNLQESMALVIGFLVVCLVIYLFGCYCLKLLVEKTGNEPGIMVWLPILQVFPALRAAGMSGWWFGGPVLAIFGIMALAVVSQPGPWMLSIFIPYLVLFIGQIMWCVKIVQARGKGVWVTLMLIVGLFISPLWLIGFLYLAFSSSEYGIAEDQGIAIPPVFSEA